MAEERPAFLCYAKEWIAATRGLPLAARGAYWDLLCFAWLDGSVSADREDLRRQVGADSDEWAVIWPKMAPRWTERDGRLYNARLETVRAESLAFTEARRQAGRKGGLAKANAKQTLSKDPSKGVANDVAKTYPASASASASTKHKDDDDRGSIAVGPRPVAPTQPAPESSSSDPSGRYRLAAQEAHALWAAAMPGVEPTSWSMLQSAGRRRLAEFVRESGGLDRVEAFCQRVAASDYLAGRKDLPAISLFTAIAKVDRIMAGDYDNRIDGQEAIYAAVMGGAR